MSNCDNLDYWKNFSKPHYGVPKNLVVIPVVRKNGQLGDIGPGQKIPACHVEQLSLFQSGLANASSAITAFRTMVELAVPAGAVVGGERFNANVALSAPQTVGSTDTVTMQIRVADEDGVAISGTTQTILTLAVPTSGGADVANAMLEFYYDGVTEMLMVIARTRSDATYATNILTAIPFDREALQRIQIGVTQSSIAQSEVITFTYGTIGRLN